MVCSGVRVVLLDLEFPIGLHTLHWNAVADDLADLLNLDATVWSNARLTDFDAEQRLNSFVRLCLGIVFLVRA